MGRFLGDTLCLSAIMRFFTPGIKGRPGEALASGKEAALSFFRDSSTQRKASACQQL
jgi:hypothetical protein